jgi:hypothetical protein
MQFIILAGISKIKNLDFEFSFRCVLNLCLSFHKVMELKTGPLPIPRRKTAKGALANIVFFFLLFLFDSPVFLAAGKPGSFFL